MDRPYRNHYPQTLLARARTPEVTLADLECIRAELQIRNWAPDLPALIEIGHILEGRLAEERERQQRARTQEEDAQSSRRADGFFDWPSTDAPGSRHAFRGVHFDYKDGLLQFVGYKVGKVGVSESSRRQLLDCVFHNELPAVESWGYMNEWATPRSAARLQKMAESIAAFARNAKRNTAGDYSVAIDEWEQDLGYLHDRYYLGHFRFEWPANRYRGIRV